MAFLKNGRRKKLASPSEMYDYFQLGSDASFTNFESAIFNLLRRQPESSEISKLFPRVDNPRSLPMSISENFIEWRGSVQIDSIAQNIMNKKKNLVKNRIIGLLPLGPFPDTIDVEYLLDMIANWMSCFFMGYRVQCLPQVTVKQFPHVTTRYHSKTRKFQILSPSLMKNALNYVNEREPKYECLIVLSWHDLYPEDKMNFELGQGSSLHRCAVMSFGRFEPKSFAENQPDLHILTPKLIWQFLKVSAHEVCHVFGLKHCNQFHCLMNGSCSIDQAMNQPLLLCPSCLRKLKHFTKANIEHWFVGVRIFLSSVLKKYPDFPQLQDCVNWLDRIVDFAQISALTSSANDVPLTLS